MTPGERHKVVFRVRKDEGTTAVPDALHPTPYATINTTISDKDTMSMSPKVSATQVLQPGGFVEIPVDNIVPNAPLLQACATIDPIHKEKGQNMDASNDGPVCKIFSGEANFAITSFEVADKSFRYCNNQNPGSELLSFNFDALNSTEDNQPKNVLIRLTKGYIQQGAVENFESNSPIYPFSGNWSRSNIAKASGNYSFKSASIGHNGISTAQTTFTVSGNNSVLSFKYLVSSESNYDFFNVYLNGTRIVRNSGESGWTSVSKTLSPGTHTLKFEYSKDYSVVKGYDAAFVDDLSIGGTIVGGGSSGDVIREEVVTLQPNESRHFTWTANVPLQWGEMPFNIEVNPLPREYTEYRKDGQNPYLDNAKTDSVLVEKIDCDGGLVCKTVRTQNNWTQEYTIREIRGYIEYYQTRCCSGSSPNRSCSTCTKSRCKTTDRWTWKTTISHYEKFMVEKILFRSKLTDDTQGGWIDLLTKGPGKIKAGYGFELKVTTVYDTNRYSARPKDKTWCSGCCSTSVSPGYSTVNSPNNLTLYLPFDVNNNSLNLSLNTDPPKNTVKYTSELVKATSGSWDDYRVTYTLPKRDLFNVGEQQKIYIPETTTNGKYNLRIDTDSFYGTYDKPSKQFPYTVLLCDKKLPQIQILGSDKDDLITQIIQ